MPLNDCRIIPMSDAPHRIVYFCTSLLTLHSPRVHIACVLLCGVGWREQIFSANFATPSPDAATARVGGHGRFSSTTDCEKKYSRMPIFHLNSLSDPGVEVYSALTEAQLRSKVDPSRGVFIAESPKVIHWRSMRVMNPSRCSARSGISRAMRQMCSAVAAISPSIPVCANSWRSSRATPSPAVCFVPCAAVPKRRWQKWCAMRRACA